MESRLIFITDVARYGEAATWTAAQRLCAAAKPSSVAVQLRDRQLSGRDRLQLACALRTLTRDAGQHLTINDRVDLALLAQADGVHLGEEGVPAALVRRHFPTLWISSAWHAGPPTPGADAYLLSPVVEARKENAALGLSGLRQRALSEAGARIYALGGVSAVTAPRCLEAGAYGVAVIGAGYSEPEALLRALDLLR